MRTPRHTFIVAAFVMLGAACSDATAPIEARATVIVPDTLVAGQLLSSSAQWMQFTLPISIRNTASVPLTFMYCASSIEAQNGGSWTNVWSPICSLTPGSFAPILPGETRVVTATITASVAGNGGPPWGSPTIGGTYRFAAGLLPDGFSGTIPTIRSNAFTLTLGN